ncbi:MAG: outer membrane protein OmpA-like peptidoglycan-associated protein [Sphingobacteriales bacterium]|jgi:outer membrane protein OmpA-like peptidoglycan-associated protein
MINRVKLTLLLVLSVGFGLASANAQSFSNYYNGTLYDAVDNPSRAYFTDSACKKFATSFIIPTIDFNFSILGPFNKTARQFVFSDSLTFDQFKDKKNNRNFLLTNATISFLSLKFSLNREKQSELSFNVGLNVNSRIGLNDQLFLLAGGNSPLAGQQLDNILNLNSNTTGYLEATVGYRTQINDKLGFGANIGLVNGLANVTTKVDESFVFTEENGEYIDVMMKGTARSSLSSDSTGFTHVVEDFLAFRNTGYTISAGAEYQQNDQLKLTLGVKDFGQIFWGEGAETYTIDKTLRYKGVNINSSKDLRDSIAQNYEKFVTDTLRGSYSSSLPARLEGGANYTWNNRNQSSFVLSKPLYSPDLDIALLNDYRFLGPLHLLTQLYVSSTGLYSIGGGLLLKGKGVELYVAMEQLANQVINSRKAVDLSRNATMPLGADFNMGLAFKFGMCPKNEVVSKVASDKDGDGIIDDLDKCPDVPGSVDRNGCLYLDTDGDGIIDLVDECPTEKGVVERNGCPVGDTDGDGIPGPEDSCPEVAGPRENNGCPYSDTDGDGLLDDVDACPTVAGPRDKQGCPFDDQDKDGVLDKKDKCPTVAGPMSNKGCPYEDTDKDGVIDLEDKCPTTPGFVENNGCPAEPKQAELTAEEKEVIDLAFKNLVFETGSSTISSVSFNTMNKLADLLSARPEFQLVIEGHTDNVGSVSFNKRLSQQRTDAVKKFFLSRDIDVSRLTAIGYGPARPIADNKTAVGRAKNRRVEFKLLQ